MTAVGLLVDDRQLMRLHVAALFTHDDRGRMLRVNEPAGGGPAPRFFLGRTRHGHEWRVRDDIVDDDVLAEVVAAVSRESATVDVLSPPESPAPYDAIVARSGAVQRISSGPAFACPTDLAADARPVLVRDANAEILRRHLSAWLPDIPTAQPMFAITVDGHAVAVCASVRITDAAHEAGVETTPEHRGRGYAGAAVTAWASAVRRSGAQPLYSTSRENLASRAVARKLGLHLFGTDLSIT